MQRLTKYDSKIKNILYTAVIWSAKNVALQLGWGVCVIL